MYKKTQRDHDQTGGKRTEARSTKEASSCAHGDHDEHDLQPFEHHGFEARKPSQPIERHFVTTRLIAQLLRLGSEGYRLIVQSNDSRGAQNRLAQPARAEHQQQDTDDELQQVQRNPIKEWPHCKHHEYKKRKADKGADHCRPPTADKGDREHDRECLNCFDKRA
jgi:hypothetical protein